MNIYVFRTLDMHERDRLGESMAALLALCTLVLACAGCTREPARAPSHRFVEDVVPGDRWHETKVMIASETRNVLFAPYRSEPREIEVSDDGTISFGAVADSEKLSPGATGVRIEFQQLRPKGEGAKEGEATSYIHVPLPAERDLDALVRKRVRVLPADGDTRTVAAWAREVIPLPQEYVTKPVRIPSSARLGFGIALEDERPDASVRFTVSVERGGRRTTVFTQTLDLDSAGFEAGWADASLDLSELAGLRVSFVFRTEIVHDGAGESDAEAPSYVSPVWSGPLMYSTEAEKEADRPNVVLISLDTLRADHLGCYGYDRDTSPNIDKFAEDGFLFEHAIASSSWTLPSHASVFTGLHPSVHGAILFPFGPPIGQAETTLAEHARQHGYLTAAYTEGVWVRAALGFAQGFERYSDGPYSGGGWAHFPGTAAKTFNAALEWVREYGEHPFFLFVHTYQTHGPYAPPGRFATMFDSDYTGPVGKTIMVPHASAKSFTNADKVHTVALYDGEIAYTDEVVGGFLNKLEQMGVLDNTVVVIFSDHGEEFWEHGDIRHGKTLYEEQVRVPLIIRFAGPEPPAGRVTRQVSLTDLYGTVAEILGITEDLPSDCMSLLPLVGSGQPHKKYTREVVVSELVEQNLLEVAQRMAERDMSVKWRMRAVRTDREKYIKSEKKQTEEVYDLHADPGEKNNIAAQDQSRLEHYRGLLATFLERLTAQRRLPPEDEPRAAPLTEEVKRRLKALGYL